MMLNKRGSTMIYSAIMALVLSGGALVTMKFSQDSRQSRNKQIINYEAGQVMYDIGNQFIKASTCVQTLQGPNGPGIDSTVFAGGTADISQIITTTDDDDNNGIVIYTEGGALGTFGDASRQIQITDMQLINIQPASMQLQVTFDLVSNNAIVKGSDQLIRTMNLNVQTGEGGLVVACYADGTQLTNALDRFCTELGGTLNNATLTCEYGPGIPAGLPGNGHVHNRWTNETAETFCNGLNFGLNGNADANGDFSGDTDVYTWNSTTQECERSNDGIQAGVAAQPGPIYDYTQGFRNDGSLIKCRANCNSGIPGVQGATAGNRDRTCSSIIWTPALVGGSDPECTAAGIQCRGGCNSCTVTCGTPQWSAGSPPTASITCNLDNSACVGGGGGATTTTSATTTTAPTGSLSCCNPADPGCGWTNDSGACGGSPPCFVVSCNVN